MKEFVRLGWHLDGLTFEGYLNLTDWERTALLVELDDMIGRANEEGALPTRPKEMR